MKEWIIWRDLIKKAHWSKEAKWELIGSVIMKSPVSCYFHSIISYLLFYSISVHTDWELKCLNCYYWSLMSRVAPLGKESMDVNKYPFTVAPNKWGRNSICQYSFKTYLFCSHWHLPSSKTNVVELTDGLEGDREYFLITVETDWSPPTLEGVHIIHCQYLF